VTIDVAHNGTHILNESDLRELIDQRDALAAIAQRIYPYMERVSHIHLPDGSLLQASEVWDATNKPAEHLVARLSAERKAGMIEGLKCAAMDVGTGAVRYVYYYTSDGYVSAWAPVDKWLNERAVQIERGEDKP
jgi:hypothetical protein